MKNKIIKLLVLILISPAFAACESEPETSGEVAQINEEVSEPETSESEPIEKEVKSEKDENKEVEDKSQVKKQTIEVKKEEDPKKDSQNKKGEETPPTENPQESLEDKAYTKDGSYVTSFIAEKNGEVGEYGTSTMYDLEIDGDYLIVKGSLDYRENPEDLEAGEIIENKEDHTFKISDETVFQAVGGMAEPEIFSKEEFLHYAEEVKNSGLALVIWLEDGVCKTVSISS